MPSWCSSQTENDLAENEVLNVKYIGEWAKEFLELVKRASQTKKELICGSVPTIRVDTWIGWTLANQRIATNKVLK